MAGLVLGAGGTLWSRRRLQELSSRARSGRLSGDVLRSVDRRARRVGRSLQGAVHAGRAQARRREEELRHRLHAGRPVG
ncbi:MAG: hypothetical protein ACYDB3_12495 [Acidimicrobiales bacterium]